MHLRGFAPPGSLSLALGLIVLIVFGWASAQRALVTVPESGQARAVIPLDSEFRHEDLEISMAGWHQTDGELQEGFPEALSIRFPAMLPASPDPLLPLYIRVARPLQGTESLTLVLHILMKGQVRKLEVVVAMPRLAVFELEVPEQVRALPDRSTVTTVLIRNSGNAEGTARFSFQGLDVHAPDTLVPAGEERAVRLELPPLTGGETVLTLIVSGGAKEQRHRIRVSGARHGNSRRYGLLAAIRSVTRIRRQQGDHPVEGRLSLSLQGYLSRTTYLDAAIGGQGFGEDRDARLLLRHRGSSLEFGDPSKTSPAGDVGTGLYLTQALDHRSLLDELALGFALPTNDEQGTPRFGVRVASGSLQSTVSLGLSNIDPLAELTANFAPVHVSFESSPLRDTLWKAGASYSTRQFGVRLEGTRTTGASLLAMVQRYSPPSTPLGRLDLQARAEVTDWRFSELSFKVNGDNGQLIVTTTPDSGTLDAEYRFYPAPLELKLNASAPMWGVGLARLAVNVAFPAGPLDMDAGTTLNSAGGFDTDASARYAVSIRNGQLIGFANLTLNNLLGQPRGHSVLKVDYADYGGFRGQLDATLPLLGPAGTPELRMAISYSSFLPSPPDLALALDGPDPSVRRLTLLLDDGGSVTPLTGVRLEGCGPPVETDAEGTALLSGPAGSCDVTIDRNSLPQVAFADGEIISLEPGAAETLVLPIVGQLLARVRYRDRETGEVLVAGQPREVRVMVAGPVTRWSPVSLPAGEFKMDGLPIGDYQIYIVGSGERKRVTISAKPQELLLTLPVSRHAVLDPATLTPQVSIDLTSLMTAPGEPIRLGIASKAPVERILVRSSGAEAAFDPPAEAGARWDIEVPVEPEVSGAIPVEVEIEFASGQVARRSLQVIVMDDAAAGVGRATPDSPAASDPRWLIQDGELPEPIQGTGTRGLRGKCYLSE